VADLCIIPPSDLHSMPPVTDEGEVPVLTSVLHRPGVLDYEHGHCILVHCHFHALCSVPPGKYFSVSIAEGGRTGRRPGLDGEAKTGV
jgi:hypothetical protein